MSFSYCHTDDSSCSDGSLGWPLGNPGKMEKKFMWEEKREKRETELSGGSRLLGLLRVLARVWWWWWLTGVRGLQRWR